MTFNLHLIEAVARERATDARHRAAASHTAADIPSAPAPAQPTVQSQPVETARHDLIPAGAPER
jgi:hypothetical protein